MQNNKPYIDNNFVVSEASLARVLSRESASTDMALLTAYRQLIPPKENKRRNKQLLGKMNARGMGPYVLIGHWQECQDNAIPYEDCPEDDVRRG